MIFLNKELVFLEKEIKRIEIKIKNKDFLSKAPNRIVNENKQKLKKLYQMKNKAITEKSLLSEKEKV